MLNSTLGSTVNDAVDEQVISERAFFTHPRYVDLGPISRGAFGDVRRVLDTRWDRPLAMKIMRRCITSAEYCNKRFMVEVEIMRSLTHPGILPVHHSGEFDDGRLWFTMPEVRGCTFAVVLDELHARDVYDVFRSSSFRHALTSFAQFCEIVDFAHGHGVVHRDLKPKNMMIAVEGETFVIDWGIAKQLTSEPHLAATNGKSKARQARTEPGEVLGTPAYMPPEQAFGNIPLQSSASDVYSLGAVLYHLLAGQPPYRGTRPAVLAQIKRGAPHPIADVFRGDRNPPKELVGLCEAAMLRLPDKRISRARAIAQAIRDWLDKSADFNSQF
ncbi:MAG TPA: serine/threonine-protein kinase [Polyangium sp.]|nr:serine/threonine-protein kinase [Polyangium sp.]